MEKKQHYLNESSRNLNINKVAGSLLGYKHTEANKLKFSLKRRGVSYKKTSKLFMNKKSVSYETISKLRSRSRGAAVCVFDLELSLVKEFSTIKETAKFTGLSPTRKSKYLTKGTIWNNGYYFKFK